MAAFDPAIDLVCFSHLRWNFVFQRPQHLLARFARSHRIHYIEEPVASSDDGRIAPAYVLTRSAEGVNVVTPRCGAPLGSPEADLEQRAMLTRLRRDLGIDRCVAWYYTPAALRFSRDLDPLASVYDCMDELSAFAGADPALPALERELLCRVDLVFTGGLSLYESKRQSHPRVRVLPSSVDEAHFRQAQHLTVDPPDQAAIPRPRAGFYAVLDERLDADLLRAVARRRRDWRFVILGPIAKIRPEDLPQEPNIHYLGPKPYAELPAYLAGWDVAMQPFALNAATRFISPTKTLEYLAARTPVVSTPITDVVATYGPGRLVEIAGDDASFAAALDAARARRAQSAWRRDVDRLLAQTSWDRAWQTIDAAIGEVLSTRERTGAAAR